MSPLLQQMSLRLASRAFSGTRLATARVRFNTGAVSRRSFRTEAVLEDVVTDPDTRIPADPESGPQPGQLTPAQADRARFRCHWSVDMWRDFNPRTWLAGIDDDGAPVSDRLRAFGDTLSNALTTTGILSGDTRAAQYWAYHTARTGFFTVQAILGLAAARAAASSSSSSTEAMSRMEAIARNGWQGPLAEAFLSYYQDYENIKEGKYILPWDMTTATHRQYNPLYVLQGARRFVTEAVDALRRREAGTPEDVWLRSATMPSYYQATFHYQTDGWLSDRSAKVRPTMQGKYLLKSCPMARLSIWQLCELS